VGLAVRDERRHDFDRVEKIRELRGLKIGLPLDTAQLEYAMRRYFDGSDADFVRIEFWKPFFEGAHPEVDAFLMPAEHASGWSLLHPEFTVVVPQPDPVQVPTAFGVAMGADGLQHLLDEWIIYAGNAGIISQGYDYWVTGEGARSTEPRWSILRDVLKWHE
jgi:hypothetical protein